MTTLTPRRDAISAAVAAVREASQSLPPPKDRIVALNRKMAHDVLDVTLIPVAEAMDHGADRARASAMLANAFSNAIASFSLSCANGDEAKADRYAQEFLADLLARTRANVAGQPHVQAVAEYTDECMGRAQ